MKSDEIDAYLARLTIELRKHGVADARIVEEARGHLADAAEQGVQLGLAPDVAERHAIARFGAADLMAATFASERYRRLDQLLFVAAVLVGLAIAYVDSRPNWNDAGVTAWSMVVAAGVFSAVAPRRPWLWALAIGIWIPLHTLARSPSAESLTMLFVIVFPFAGASAGMTLRRVHAMFSEPSDGRNTDFHDKSGSFHFVLKTKRGWVNPELAAIVAEPDTQLVPFLERVAPPPLGPLGKLQSLTVLGDGKHSATLPTTYQAVFGQEAKIICTVTINGAGKGVSLDWSRECEPNSDTNSNG
jgi:hypothetical protein